MSDAPLAAKHVFSFQTEEIGLLRLRHLSSELEVSNKYIEVQTLHKGDMNLNSSSRTERAAASQVESRTRSRATAVSSRGGTDMVNFGDNVDAIKAKYAL